VLVAVDRVPGFGWTTIVPDTSTVGGSARADRRHLANEHVTVDIGDDGTATLTVDGITVRGANRYIDGGDGGDAYNYSPPDRDRLVDAPLAVDTEVVEGGPVRARIRVTATYAWPVAATGDETGCRARADESLVAEIRTTFELRTGERFLRVHVELDNRARDHRLRAHFPLPGRVDGSDGETAFAVVRRGLTAEGGVQEAGLPTFVSHRFVDCSGEHGGLAVLHDGLHEYEVVDGGSGLALTLFRATGYLSRTAPGLRPLPAGPPIALAGAQLQRPLAFDYALLPHRGDWEAARLYDAADAMLIEPMLIEPGVIEPGVVGTSAVTTPSQPGSGRWLRVTGAEVSSVRRERAGAPVTLRLFVPGPAPARVAVVGLGVPGEDLELRGYGIITLTIDGS
jgi:alpha-mannosidase